MEKAKAGQTLELMEAYYNGYTFSYSSTKPVYNPTLVLHFLKEFEKSCVFPRKMPDANLAADDEKLEYISRLGGGGDLVMDLLKENRPSSVVDILDRFGMKDLSNDESHDRRFILSFLYYFGILTIAGETDGFETVLKIPNLVIKSLYAERAEKMFLPDPQDRDEGRDAGKELQNNGDI